MLSSADLTQMRSDLATAWPDTATISRITHTSDGAGGTTTVWTDDAATVLCRLAPLSGDERVIASKMDEIYDYMCNFPHATVVDPHDQVKIGTRTFEVISVAHGSWELLVRALLKEIK